MSVRGVGRRVRRWARGERRVVREARSKLGSYIYWQEVSTKALRVVPTATTTHSSSSSSSSSSIRR